MQLQLSQGETISNEPENRTFPGFCFWEILWLSYWLKSVSHFSLFTEKIQTECKHCALSACDNLYFRNQSVSPNIPDISTSSIDLIGFDGNRGNKQILHIGNSLLLLLECGGRDSTELTFLLFGGLKHPSQ